jgi:uncharacterized repeat protein (TIGR03847 family)
MAAMESSSHDYGQADSIDAEAIGEPGQRRFRLLIKSGGRQAALWMEKQQLASIGDWLNDLVPRLDREKPSPERAAPPESFGAIFDVDMRASQIGLGYDETDDRFAFQVVDMQTRGRAADFQCSISRAQGRALLEKIVEVVSAGRPICPLCQQPMDPSGHVCPRSNGHHLSTA